MRFALLSLTTFHAAFDDEIVTNLFEFKLKMKSLLSYDGLTNLIYFHFEEMWSVLKVHFPSCSCRFMSQCHKQ